MLPAKLAIIWLITCLLSLGQVENKAVLGIGTRLPNDQLLLKDVREARPAGVAESPTIGFKYAMPEQITYIEIVSDENILAEVNFSYRNDLVEGTVTAINATTQPFAVLITIYGFNETMANVNTLNRDHFEGILQPQESLEDDEEYLNLSDEGLDDFYDTRADDDAYDGDDDEHFDADFGTKDKIIELGRRQKGDYLIYETYQTSTLSTQQPTKHSVVFYYVDSNYITCAKFVVFDYFGDKSAEDKEQTNDDLAEYSHYSPHTLKAIITDRKTKSLFVQMFLYGYRPMDQPVDYLPFQLNLGWHDGSISHMSPPTVSPMSPVQRLKMLMNAQKHEVVTETPSSPQDSDGGKEVSLELKSDVHKKGLAGLESARVSSGGASSYYSVEAAYLSIAAVFMPLWIVGSSYLDLVARRRT